MPSAPVPAAADGRLTEVGGLGSTTPTLVDLDALAGVAKVVPSTPLSCDPDTGAVIGGVVPASLARRARRDAARRHDGYVVPTAMARLVRLRDGRCRFPNCSINAVFTDQDHVIPWPVGATTPTNLMCLCRRHHRIKQRHGWSVRLDPDGTVHWTDPTGRAWTTHPVDHLNRATVPLEVDHPRPDPDPAPTPTPTRTFRLQALELDDIPSLLEDHLWRRLAQAEQSGPDSPVAVLWAPDVPSHPPF